MRTTLVSAALLALVSATAYGQASVPPTTGTPPSEPNPGMGSDRSAPMPTDPGTMKPATPGNPGKPGMDPGRRPYGELDANRDGNLTAEEFGRIYPGVPYESIDSNGDGRVSEQEYRDGLQKRPPMGGADGKPRG